MRIGSQTSLGTILDDLINYIIPWEIIGMQLANSLTWPVLLKISFTETAIISTQLNVFSPQNQH